MGVAARALRLLWPRGHAHRLAGHGSALIAALGDVLDTLRDSARSIVSESRPDEASAMLPEWHAALGLRYDPTLPADTQRTRLAATLFSVGGSTRSDLERQIQKEFPDITIEEVSASAVVGEGELGAAVSGGTFGDIAPGMFDVRGTLNNDTEAERLAAIIQHFAPLHLAPFSKLTILSDSGTSELGVAVTGLAICGV